MRKSEDTRFEDAFAQILRWHQDEDKYPLSDAVQAELNRWKTAWQYILTMKPLADTSVVSFLQQTFSISEPQAWRDVRNCKRYYASTQQVNRDFDEILLVANIKDLRTKAEFVGDLKVVAQCNASLSRIQAEKETPPAVSAGKTIILEISFDPKLIGAKEIPNLLAEVEKFIGEAARRELMIEDENQ